MSLPLSCLQSCIRRINIHFDNINIRGFTNFFSLYESNDFKKFVQSPEAAGKINESFGGKSQTDLAGEKIIKFKKISDVRISDLFFGQTDGQAQ